jgi:hypothetical protein
MISNERPSPYGRQPDYHPQYEQPRPRPPEETPLRVELPVERKMFVLMLKENPRGRFLRIIEDTGSDRRPTVSIIFPATGL